MARKRSQAPAASKRNLDARPDTVDFRDKMYVPTLVEVPTHIELDEYRRWGVPILDQGLEGACTGFGLAAVAHYLLRRRQVDPDVTEISPRMFYEMAKRYDEWPGEDYDGSSARGAMKGWHKHGVCSNDLWPYDVNRPDQNLTNQRADDAVDRPLGAYFRVNHKDIVAMHSAMAEVGILYATALVHEGWSNVRDDGTIPNDEKILGGHAFAIVAYNQQGFWIQNSWGDDWGFEGFAHLSYDDWLQHGKDIWVARLGAPVRLRSRQATASSRAVDASGSVYEAFSQNGLRPHIINVGNDGLLNPNGTFGTSEADVAEIFATDIPRITAGWSKKRVLLYAHGGLTAQSSAVQRLADYRPLMLESEIYPLQFVWHTDFWTTLVNILKESVSRRRPEGFLDSAKDFMLDRLDDALEPLARNLGGKAQWDEMKENAILATLNSKGGGRIVMEHLAKLISSDPSVEVHVAGHSAGSIFLAPLVHCFTAKGNVSMTNPKTGRKQRLKGHGGKISTATLWAPACTNELFAETFLPAIDSGGLSKFALFTLTDKAEQDDHCANIYHKSLLYLVSNAFEEKPRIPFFRPSGVPLLGMETFVENDPRLVALFKKQSADWILAPNTEPAGGPNHSTSTTHGDFDDDSPTLRATLTRILGTASVKSSFDFQRSSSSLRDQRQKLA